MSDEKPHDPTAPPTPPPWEPPLNGTADEHLLGMLDRLRWTFRWKADGLTDEQLRHRLPSSQLSIGALLKHLAMVEENVVARSIRGERPSYLDRLPDGLGPDDAHEFGLTLTDEDTPASLYAQYDAAVARSRAALTDLAAAGRLDEPGAFRHERWQPSIRRHVSDLVEEMGRHAGHADLLREAIDGRVGEDPPEDWRPPTPVS